MDQKTLEAVKKSLPKEPAPAPEVKADGDVCVLTYANKASYAARTSMDMAAVNKSKDLLVMASEVNESEPLSVRITLA